MKRFLAALLFASAVAFGSNTAAFASTDADAAIEETSGSIDEEASTPKGEAAVIDRIEKEFDVDESTVKALRDKKLGYGEISIALSLAERLPGGITEENIDRIISMRQGPPVEGWGNIAKDLNLSLKPALSHLEKIESKPEKGDSEKSIKSEKAEKGERVERPAKPEKMERMERPERPGKGGR